MKIECAGSWGRPDAAEVDEDAGLFDGDIGGGLCERQGGVDAPQVSGLEAIGPQQVPSLHIDLSLAPLVVQTEHLRSSVPCIKMLMVPCSVLGGTGTRRLSAIA